MFGDISALRSHKLGVVRFHCGLEDVIDLCFQQSILLFIHSLPRIPLQSPRVLVRGADQLHSTGVN